MRIPTVFIFVLSFAYALGFQCTDISGKWQNELGSHMLLNVDAANRITGEYWTAVEAKPGAAAFVSNITGKFSSKKDGSLVAFAVLFNHGSSLASWVGQCMVCDGKEILHTTYILRKYVSDDKEKWSSIIVNQNTFSRSQNEMTTNLLTTRISSIASDSIKDGLEEFQIHGKWKSDSDEEIEIYNGNDTTTEGGLQISGKWRTNINEETEIGGICDISEENYDASGLYNLNKDGRKFIAIALVTSTKEKIRSWAGHASADASSIPKILETAWLEHEFNPSCAAPRANVRFGMEKFTLINSGLGQTLKEPETIFEKIRRFFTSMF